LIEEEIAKRFVELLKKRNLTTYKYTKNCSVSKNSAYNVSQGKNVRIDTLNQICEDLGINLHKFFEYQDKEDITLSEDEKILIDDYRTTTKSWPRAEFDLSSTLKVQARSSWSLQNGDIANRFNPIGLFRVLQALLFCNCNYCCALGSGVCLRFVRTPEWRKNEHTEHGDNRRKIESTEIEGGI